MAKYHKHMEYHEDAVEKHALTAGEAEYLSALQKEMNTQDDLCQADPRFWVIVGTEKTYGYEDGYADGAELVDVDGDTVATDMESATAYIRDELLDGINEADGIQREVRFSDGIFHATIIISWDDEWEYLECMEDVADWLNSNGYKYMAVNYKCNDKAYPGTMFLTQKAAERHLRENAHHYPADAHTYAVTAWRNPEVERLWEILRQVDWEALIPNLGPAGK